MFCAKANYIWTSLSLFSADYFLTTFYEKMVMD